MANLPADFTASTRQLMGNERFERYLQSFEEPAPVSIRLNPKKSLEVRGESLEVVDAVKKSGNFTISPTKVQKKIVTLQRNRNLLRLTDKK